MQNLTRKKLQFDARLLRTFMVFHLEMNPGSFKSQNLAVSPSKIMSSSPPDADAPDDWMLPLRVYHASPPHASPLFDYDALPPPEPDAAPLPQSNASPQYNASPLCDCESSPLPGCDASPLCDYDALHPPEPDASPLHPYDASPRSDYCDAFPRIRWCITVEVTYEYGLHSVCLVRPHDLTGRRFWLCRIVALGDGTPERKGQYFVQWLYKLGSQDTHFGRFHGLMCRGHKPICAWLVGNAIQDEVKMCSHDTELTARSQQRIIYWVRLWDLDNAAHAL
jgi:hypothetical protein